MIRGIRAVLTAVAVPFLAAIAPAQSWPAIYDPLVLRTLNLEMSETDWQTIQHDETLSIWVPTLMNLDGEAPILVAIRRKSADPLSAAPGFLKVSYKIDINELVSGQNWHGLRALSLDNGDDENVVSEGLAWYLHRVASGPEGYGYDAGLASWVRLFINGVDTGVYVSAEQRDKRFLENRGLWIEDETWLYEVEDINGMELDEGEGDSPLVTSLCYSPFASPSSCPTPDAATLAAALPPVIHMQGLLALAAVDAFSRNPDALISHGKNFYFADYLSVVPRHYFPWDLDSALSGGVNHNVYAYQSAYAQVLLSVPSFRQQYSRILNDLLCGPFDEASLHGFLDALEPVLSDALANDPNNQLGGSVAEFFAGRKSWFSQRIAAVQSQIEGFVPCTPGCAPTPTVYCSAKLNSLGCSPSISMAGTPSASSGSGCTVSTSSMVGQKVGLYVHSTTGGAATPFHGGYLCIESPIKRHPASNTGGTAGQCNGVLSEDFNAYVASGADPALVAGATVWIQAWARDPGDPFGDSLSNALSTTLCP